MAGTNRTDAIDIKNELLTNSRSFSFFQAMRLLKSFISENDEVARLNTDVNIDNLKINPKLSLAFPMADIDKVEFDKDSGKYNLTANILGLYGTGSPLPTFYTEDLFDDISKGNNTAKDFLDIINHRLYELLFAGWSKYRSMQKIVEEKSRIHADILFSLIGMSEETLRNDFQDPVELLRYTGLFAMGPRSSSGLETILNDALGGITIKIIQAVKSKGIIPDDQKALLGLSTSLGVNSQLGSECIKSNGAFRIEIGPVSDREYRELLPGKDRHKKLVALTELYMSHPFDYDLEVILDEKEKQGTICLGSEKCSSLGLDTWVFSNEGPDEFRSRFYPDKAA